jgi:hypothetical protein
LVEISNLNYQHVKKVLIICYFSPDLNKNKII